MRRLLGLLTVLTVGGFIATMVVAYREKLRRGDQPPFDEMADELDRSVIFDNLDAASRSKAFRGGDLDIWFGGGRLDLRGATLDPAGAELRVRSIFGGLEIDVPETWPIDLNQTSFAGGVGGMRDPSLVDESLPRLIIEATSIFGGVAILNRPGDELAGFDELEDTVAIPIQSESSAVTPG